MMPDTTPFYRVFKSVINIFYPSEVSMNLTDGVGDCSSDYN
jgi:hypothetical protein